MRTLQVGDWVSHVNRPGEYGEVVQANDCGCIRVKWRGPTWKGETHLFDYTMQRMALLRVIPAPALPEESDHE